MAVLRLKEIRAMSEKDLGEKLKSLRLELAKERANINIGASVSSPGKIREVRRTIAKILTVKGEKRLKHA
jgi:large subunit ribosomal protein L29